MLQITHVVTDLSGRFLEADDKYCEILELSLEDLRKRDILSVTDPIDHQSNAACLRRLVEQGVSFWIKKRYHLDSGRRLWVLNHVSRLIGPFDKTRIAAASFLLPENLASQSLEVDCVGVSAQTEILKHLLN